MKKSILCVALALLFTGCHLFDPPPPAPPPLLKMGFIGYTDYYDGINIALEYDLTNNGAVTIIRFRPEIEMTWKYNAGTQTFRPDVSLTIPPGATIYSYWIPVAYGYVFYSSHKTKEVIVWFDDGSQIVVNQPE